jgi:hypothetical protein
MLDLISFRTLLSVHVSCKKKRGNVILINGFWIKRSHSSDFSFHFLVIVIDLTYKTTRFFQLFTLLDVKDPSRLC